MRQIKTFTKQWLHEILRQMDGTRKYHPEWDNPVIKEHTWHALADEWILAEKLRILKKQFTDCMTQLKMKDDQSVDASVLLRRGNKILTRENTVTKSGAGTKGKVIQRLPHLRINCICSHQPQSLLLMARSACWQEPYMDVSWEALPEFYWYRWGCLQLTIGLSIQTLIEELEKGLKELEGFATPWEGKQY